MRPPCHFATLLLLLCLLLQPAVVQAFDISRPGLTLVNVSDSMLIVTVRGGESWFPKKELLVYGHTRKSWNPRHRFSSNARFTVSIFAEQCAHAAPSTEVSLNDLRTTLHLSLTHDCRVRVIEDKSFNSAADER